MQTDIKVTKTEPVITNKLPSIFDRTFYSAHLEINFGTADLSNPYLVITMTYQINDEKGEDKGSYQYQTTYTILSNHPPYNNCQIFHEMILRSIREFNELVRQLSLINYPPGQLLEPSFATNLPRLKRLLYPHLEF